MVSLMEDKIRALIVYDISDNKRRNKCMKLLNLSGYRIQYSVYEVVLSLNKYNKMKEAVGKLEHEEDSIVVYKLNSFCTKTSYGKGIYDKMDMSNDIFL